MILSYRGEALAELVPTAPPGGKLSPLAALDLAQESSGQLSPAAAEAYLRQLRADQKGWSRRGSR